MLLLLAPLAAAYTYEGWAWQPEAMPVEVHWTGTQPGMTHDEVQAAIEGAAEAWTVAMPCGEGLEAVEDADADAWFQAGGVAVLFGEPGEEAGVEAFEVSPHAEYVLSDDTSFTSDANIDAGSCPTGTFSLQAVLTHEFGHLLGLSHSCVDGEPCTDASLRDATMYWAIDDCDTNASTLGADDIAGIQSIYGEPEPLGFSCRARDTDPLTVDCTISDPVDDGTLAPAWDFGDGTTGEGSPISHTYATFGGYSIGLCVQDAACGMERCDTHSFLALAPSSSPPGPADGPEHGGCATGEPGASTMGLVLAAVALGGGLSRPSARRRHARPPAR